ncbi:MAG: Gfo/Idh/MocA family oxidoreductase, partial [Gemmatimonadota bacterium]|nr:Gfo/Idh/MocA family oxidoreductase [Gemmatimonadota bacterium]
MSGQTRREMLKNAALGGAALAVGAVISPAIAEDVSAGTRPDLAPPAPPNRATMKNVPFERMGTVRFGIVGTGLRGRSVLSELLAIGGVRVTAVCDVVADKTARAVKMCTDAGQPAPAVIVAGDAGYEQLVARDDVDFVYTATPWEFHTPVMLAALAHGKHCGSECPIGTTL